MNFFHLTPDTPPWVVLCNSSQVQSDLASVHAAVVVTSDPRLGYLSTSPNIVIYHSNLAVREKFVNNFATKPKATGPLVFPAASVWFYATAGGSGCSNEMAKKGQPCSGWEGALVALE
jgi:hypothetical protein